MQTCYIRNYMRKPSHALTCKCVGAIFNINNYFTEFPTNYEVGQKLNGAALINPLLARLTKSPRNLLTEHGYNPENGTINRFTKLCERAEVAESIGVDKRTRQIIEGDNYKILSNGSNCRSRKKPK